MDHKNPACAIKKMELDLYYYVLDNINICGFVPKTTSDLSYIYNMVERMETDWELECEI